jgi:hypothetical protein
MLDLQCIYILACTVIVSTTSVCACTKQAYQQRAAKTYCTEARQTVLLSYTHSGELQQLVQGSTRKPCRTRLQITRCAATTEITTLHNALPNYQRAAVQFTLQSQYKRTTLVNLCKHFDALLPYH